MRILPEETGAVVIDMQEKLMMEHDISKGTRKKLKKFIKKSTDKKSADKKAK